MQWVKKYWQCFKGLIPKLIEISIIVTIILMVQKVLLLTSEQHGINWKEILKDPQTLILGIQAWIMRRQAETSKKANDLLSEQTKMNLTSQRYAHYIEKLHRWISLLVKIEYEAEKVTFNKINSLTKGFLFYEDEPIEKSMIKLYTQLNIEYPSIAAIFSEEYGDKIKKLYSEMCSRMVAMINLKRIELGDKSTLDSINTKTIEEEASELKKNNRKRTSLL